MKLKNVYQWEDREGIEVLWQTLNWKTPCSWDRRGQSRYRHDGSGGEFDGLAVSDPATFASEQYISWWSPGLSCNSPAIYSHLCWTMKKKMMIMMWIGELGNNSTLGLSGWSGFLFCLVYTLCYRCVSSLYISHCMNYDIKQMSPNL